MQSYCEDTLFMVPSSYCHQHPAKTAMGFGYLMNKNFNGVIECIGLTSKNRL